MGNVFPNHFPEQVQNRKHLHGSNRPSIQMF